MYTFVYAYRRALTQECKRVSTEGMKVAKMSLSSVRSARLVNFSSRVVALFAREKGVYCPQLETRTIVSSARVIYASARDSERA